ncbi:MAG TPA: fibro-slime domain-containing protein [Polyangia bacterium]|nr:fibro-slime domain-containing protein [Polyangia bacterium]
MQVKQASMRAQGLGFALALFLGCAGVKEAQPSGDGGVGGRGTGGAAGNSNDGGPGGVAGAGSGGSGGGAVDGAPAPATGFTMADIGGYKLGDAIVGDGTSMNGQQVCNAVLGVVRDFKGAQAAVGGTMEAGGHPDFEVFEGRGPTKNMVSAMLGADRKPVYASQCERGVGKGAACPFGAMTTTKANFDQWYRSTDGVNKPYFVYLQMRPVTGGVSTFESKHFFPVDGAGWGNSGKDELGVERNFAFTTEIHTTFKYSGGEQFTFTGDDDVWVFVNGKLAIDLGGLHLVETATIDLDQSAATLGITRGNVYPLDLFHAERHSVGSNFRIDFNFDFADCGVVVQ